jgi:O-6-methylguanine DNA methyltransferase
MNGPKIQFELEIPTRDGVFCARYSRKGLCGLSFPSREARLVDARTREDLPSEVKRWHGMVSAALTRALAGQPPAVLPPLDLAAGTAFQQLVWRALQRIACGGTWSYGQVAESIGRPKATRAVGGACGANPIPVLIPCHRVLAAGNRLGGFSADMNWKRTLLCREGVRVPER